MIYKYCFIHSKTEVHKLRKNKDYEQSVSKKNKCKEKKLTKTLNLRFANNIA